MSITTPLVQTEELTVVSSSISPTTNFLSRIRPPFLSSSSLTKTSFSYQKKWRWWNFLGIFIVLLILSEIAVLVMSYNLLHLKTSPIRIGEFTL